MAKLAWYGTLLIVLTFLHLGFGLVGLRAQLEVNRTFGIIVEALP